MISLAPGYMPTSAESSLPWKRTQDADSIDGELDPARRLNAFPAITLNNDDVECFIGVDYDSPLKITIPFETWVCYIDTAFIL